MRLNVYISGTVQQMQRLNDEGKPWSVRPATDEEVWLFGRVQELEQQLTNADGEVERLSTEVGMLREDVDSLNLAIRELKPKPTTVVAPMAGLPNE